MSNEKENTLFPREEESQSYYAKKIQALEGRITDLEKALKYEASVALGFRNEVFTLRRRLFEYQQKFQEYERQKS